MQIENRGGGGGGIKAMKNLLFARIFCHIFTPFIVYWIYYVINRTNLYFALSSVLIIKQRSNTKRLFWPFHFIRKHRFSMIFHDIFFHLLFLKYKDIHRNAVANNTSLYTRVIAWKAAVLCLISIDTWDPRCVQVCTHLFSFSSITLPPLPRPPHHLRVNWPRPFSKDLSPCKKNRAGRGVAAASPRTLRHASHSARCQQF